MQLECCLYRGLHSVGWPRVMYVDLLTNESDVIIVATSDMLHFILIFGWSHSIKPKIFFAYE